MLCDYSTATDLGFKTEAQNGAIRKTVRKNLPPVLDGMDKAEALAYVSRLFDAAQAGAAVWGDALLFQCIARLERTARKAEESGNYACVIGAVAQMNRMLSLGADTRGFRGHPSHAYRR